MIINYPPQFLAGMKQVLGKESEELVKAFGEPPPTSVRLNPAKRADSFHGEQKVPWCAEGRYLEKRPSFTFDPLFHAGAYYVQEASSMFIEQVWNVIQPDNRPVRVLDICAAPGGKSTHLLSLMNGEGLLVCNELIPGRNKILQQNIIKWGYANCIITQNKAEDYGLLENYFDIVLVDAPCSGEGLFRKDKNAVDEWSMANVVMCCSRQKEILKHASACLKPGGFLIYSTCTFEPAENDNNVEQLLSTAAGKGEFTIANPETASAGNFPLDSWGITRTTYGFQFYPHKVKGEGFYIAVLRKEGLNLPEHVDTTDNQASYSNTDAFSYLSNGEKFKEFERNGLVFGIPETLFSAFTLLEKHFYIRNAGIFLGQHKGKDFLPSHLLALSNHIRADLPCVELNLEEAISYLRGELPKIKSPIAKGWLLVQYHNHNLGWIKSMAGRFNNYFPKEWRILKR